MPFIYLQEKESKTSLQPFSLLRPVADIRLGIFTFRERWNRLGFTVVAENEIEAIEQSGEKVFRMPASTLPLNYNEIKKEDLAFPAESPHLEWLQKPWQFVEWNGRALKNDFELMVSGSNSAPLPGSVKVSGNHQLFVVHGAKLEHCYINTTDGPVYISKDVFVMDGAMLRGPLFLGEGTVVKMGASIYGGTYGSYCTLGGELKNAVFMSYSNKAHHGYVGDSWIGEWCNLGAGTTNSNVKNTGGKVKIWDIHHRMFDYAGVKCGVFMGDFSRCAINTSFNTGTVTGICTNIFNGQQLTPKFIPDFSWGVDGNMKYEWEKAIQDIDTWMKFKGRSIDQQTLNKLKLIYQNI
jgi:UDP-N-acetylglucosamine diphosphorylase/glucosamine-1-phosphate N-acetyltransferase